MSVASLCTAAFGLMLICSGAMFAQSLTTAPVAGESGFGHPLSLPVYAAASPGDATRLFVVEQRGVIRVLDLATDPPQVLATPFLDIQPLVWDQNDWTDERGLLSMAFDPQYAANGFFYVFYVDTANQSVIARYTASVDPNVADAGSAVILKTMPQVFHEHKGGCMQFGPDGLLYVSTGDGGGGGCDPVGNGQNINSLLGKMLRLDVRNSPTYVAAGNPYIGVDGLDEIWAIGLRNPWRFSFDRLIGDLYLADVGEEQREEIDYVPSGADGGPGNAINFGWDCCEGNVPSTQSGCTPSPGCFADCAASAGSYIAPIHTHSHLGAGDSVIGGYVYRGSAIPQLAGTYVYGDFMNGNLWSFRIVDGAMTDLTNRTTELSPGGKAVILSLCSFAEDADGELYIIHRGSFDAPTGSIHKIIADNVKCAADVAPGTGDQIVGVPDVLFIINNWGPCSNPNDCPADIAPEGPPIGDDVVGVPDLLYIINNWGPC